MGSGRPRPSPSHARGARSSSAATRLRRIPDGDTGFRHRPGRLELSPCSLSRTAPWSSPTRQPVLRQRAAGAGGPAGSAKLRLQHRGRWSAGAGVAHRHGCGPVAQKRRPAPPPPGSGPPAGAVAVLGIRASFLTRTLAWALTEERFELGGWTCPNFNVSTNLSGAPLSMGIWASSAPCRRP